MFRYARAARFTVARAAPLPLFDIGRGILFPGSGWSVRRALAQSQTGL